MTKVSINVKVDPKILERYVKYEGIKQKVKTKQDMAKVVDIIINNINWH